MVRTVVSQSLLEYRLKSRLLRVKKHELLRRIDIAIAEYPNRAETLMTLRRYLSQPTGILTQLMPSGQSMFGFIVGLLTIPSRYPSVILDFEYHPVILSTTLLEALHDEAWGIHEHYLKVANMTAFLSRADQPMTRLAVLRVYEALLFVTWPEIVDTLAATRQDATTWMEYLRSQEPLRRMLFEVAQSV